MASNIGVLLLRDLHPIAVDDAVKIVIFRTIKLTLKKLHCILPIHIILTYLLDPSYAQFACHLLCIVFNLLKISETTTYVHIKSFPQIV